MIQKAEMNHPPLGRRGMICMILGHGRYIIKNGLGGPGGYAARYEYEKALLLHSLPVWIM